MMLRSLSQAVYQPENGGIWPALPAYAHFTSPIRRYPDLLVHRGIRHLIRSRDKVKGVQPGERRRADSQKTGLSLRHPRDGRHR